jgi:hypothetical protein
MTKCNYFNCNRRLKLTDVECRCKNIYCAIHRLPEEHKCLFNFKLSDTEAKKIIEMNKCVAPIVLKI